MTEDVDIQPLSKEHKAIVEKWLPINDLPKKGRILSPSTGGVETTLMAYMLCKYYEDNPDVELFFYTAGLFPPPDDIKIRMENEYKPWMTANEGSALLYRVTEKTTKKFSHMVRYWTPKEVVKVSKEKGHGKVFYAVKEFDVPYATDLINQLNIDVWFTGRNKPYTAETIRASVNVLEESESEIDDGVTHHFHDQLPFVDDKGHYKVARPFKDLYKHEVIGIYESLGIMDLFFRTVSCPHVYPGNGCHGECKHMLPLTGKHWKNNCIERLTAEVQYGLVEPLSNSSVPVESEESDNDDPMRVYHLDLDN